jgi:hypothetical protein
VRRAETNSLATPLELHVFKETHVVILLLAIKVPLPPAPCSVETISE